MPARPTAAGSNRGRSSGWRRARRSLRRRRTRAGRSASRRARSQTPRCRRARSTALPRGLLRRHVGRGAEDHAGCVLGRAMAHASVKSASRRCPGRPRRIERLGQAEVQHLDGAVGRDLDVGRLQIAMDDAAVVRRLERVGDLRARSAAPLRPGAGPRAMRSASVVPSTSSMTSARTPPASSTP